MGPAIGTSNPSHTPAASTENRAESAPGAAARTEHAKDQFDFVEWLREYRRWSEKGSCSPARRGEIEWGGDEND